MRQSMTLGPQAALSIILVATIGSSLAGISDFFDDVIVGVMRPQPRAAICWQK